jgi:hypothetical protein
MLYLVPNVLNSLFLFLLGRWSVSKPAVAFACNKHLTNADVSQCTVPMGNNVMQLP